MIIHALPISRLLDARMNGLESAWHQNLLQSRAAGEILWSGFQCVTLRLGDDCRFTIDFMVVHKDNTISLDETKGHMRDDARVKLKVASEMYPMFRFRLITREGRSGPWKVEEIK